MVANRAALTDHDTVKGVAEFLGRSRVNGIRAVAGVEITAEYDINETYHILGYGIDISNSFLGDIFKAPEVSCAEVITAIKQAGGYAVWAHPGLFCGIDIIRSRVKEFIGYGLDGIEAFHHAHIPEAIHGCIDLAKEYDLLITAGTDFHYNGSEQVGNINFHGHNVNVMLEKTIEKIFGEARC